MDALGTASVPALTRRVRTLRTAGLGVTTLAFLLLLADLVHDRALEPAAAPLAMRGALRAAATTDGDAHHHGHAYGLGIQHDDIHGFRARQHQAWMPFHVCATGSHALQAVREVIGPLGATLSAFSLPGAPEDGAAECVAHEATVGLVLVTATPKLEDRCAARWRTQAATCDVLVHADDGDDCEQLVRLRLSADHVDAPLIVVSKPPAAGASAEDQNASAANASSPLLECYSAQLGAAMQFQPHFRPSQRLSLFEQRLGERLRAAIDAEHGGDGLFHSHHAHAYQRAGAPGHHLVDLRWDMVRLTSAFDTALLDEYAVGEAEGEDGAESRAARDHGEHHARGRHHGAQPHSPHAHAPADAEMNAPTPAQEPAVAGLIEKRMPTGAPPGLAVAMSNLGDGEVTVGAVGGAVPLVDVVGDPAAHGVSGLHRGDEDEEGHHHRHHHALSDEDGERAQHEALAHAFRHAARAAKGAWAHEGAEGRVILVQPPGTPAHARAHALSALFEEGGAHKAYVAHPAVLALLGAGQHSGVHVHVGEGETWATPVVEGLALPGRALGAPLGGRHVRALVRGLLAISANLTTDDADGDTNGTAAEADWAEAEEEEALRELLHRFCTSANETGPDSAGFHHQQHDADHHHHHHHQRVGGDDDGHGGHALGDGRGVHEKHWSASHRHHGDGAGWPHTHHHDGEDDGWHHDHTYHTYHTYHHGDGDHWAHSSHGHGHMPFWRVRALGEAQCAHAMGALLGLGPDGPGAANATATNGNSSAALERLDRRLHSLHALIHAAIGRTDPNVHDALYAHIVLTGEPSALRGLADALESALSESRPHVHAHAHGPIKIIVPPAPELAVWRAASALSTLPAFQPLWVGEREWREHGHAKAMRWLY